MSVPAQVDIDIWRGNSSPVIWALPEGFSLGGSTVLLTIYAGSDTLLKLDSGVPNNGLAIDGSARFIVWSPTTAQSRLIPLGHIANYELERRFLAAQETLAYGRIVGRGGDNVDD